MRDLDARRVLIFRLGSIGDTMIALPCLHLVRRQFPNAEIAILTTIPRDTKSASPFTILRDAGLVDRGIEYAGGTRDWREIQRVAREIRNYRPDVFIYLAAPRNFMASLRDALFFRWVLRGVKIYGMPFAFFFPAHKRIDSDHFEHEGRRLARCISAIGHADIDRSESYDLAFTEAEKSKSDRFLSEHGVGDRFLVLCIGGKVAAKDWGQENWRRVLSALDEMEDTPTIVAVGSGEDLERCDDLFSAYRGKSLNLCGKLSVRESALIMRKAELFLGHDCGPMHIAAIQGVPCVAIFAPLAKPGVWFPIGTDNDVFYSYGDVRRIDSIRPEEVIEALRRRLS